MANPSKNKGDRAEREAADILTELTGMTCRRKLGAGRQDDTGDIEGIPGWTVEVKSYRDFGRAVTDGLADCTREQSNAGTPHGVTLVKRHGGKWVAVLTLDQLTNLILEREAGLR